MNEKIYTIYKATNLINNKSYIGFTSRNVGTRKAYHIFVSQSRTRKSSYFQNALDKYGINNFEWTILYQSKYKNHTLDFAENHFIIEYNTYIGFDNCNGYNLTLGGDGATGKIVSSETRQKISSAHKGRKLTEDHINKINRNPEKIRKTADKHRGMKRSDEAKQKMSDAKKGLAPSNKGTKCYYNQETNTRIYLSIEDDIPEGFSDTVPNLNKGKQWIHNPSTMERTFILKTDTIPEGFVNGYGKRN